MARGVYLRLTALALAGAFGGLAPLAGAADEPQEATQVQASEVAFDQSTPGVSGQRLGAILGEVARGEVGQGKESGKTMADMGGEPQLESVAAQAADLPEVATIGVTWKANKTEPSAVLVRQYRQGKWTEWSNIGDEIAEGKDNELHATDPLTVVGTSKVQAVIVSKSGQTITKPKLIVVDSGKNPEDKLAALPNGGSQPTVAPSLLAQNQADAAGTEAGNSQPNLSQPGVGGTPPPTTTQDAGQLMSSTGLISGARPIYSRANWGADESIRTWPAQPGTIRAAIVHHTAGANGYSPEQVPAIIRGIYYYHTVTLQWGDIGYNVLVDNFGRAWQGRAGDLRYQSWGANSMGVNMQTFGISVMGNFSNTPPTIAALDTVARVIAWKFQLENINPEGYATLTGDSWVSGVPTSTVRTIIGHRDAPPPGGYTSCPGNAFYAVLPQVRSSATYYWKSGLKPVDMPDRPGVNLKPTEPPAVNPDTSIPARITGDDRYSTSLKISAQAYPKGAKTVYLSRGDYYADALAGGSLTDGPVLIIPSRGQIPANLQAEIKRLNPQKVIALGGREAISDWRLTTLASGRQSERLVGNDRIATSTLIAKRAWKTKAGLSTIYLAEATEAIDAVAGGTLTDGAIVFVRAQEPLRAEVKGLISELKPSRVVALGGTGAISDKVLAEAGQGLATGRIAGADRFETAVKISMKSFPKTGTQMRYYVARADDPVDAVAGGALSDGPIVLVRQMGSIPQVVKDDIKRLKPRGITSLGGWAAINEDMLKEAIKLLK